MRVILNIVGLPINERKSVYRGLFNIYNKSQKTASYVDRLFAYVHTHEQMIWFGFGLIHYSAFSAAKAM